jgi:1,6-anhydro-N-acetylmuramate kinase
MTAKSAAATSADLAPMLAIGLMSGTSQDSVDVALIDTDGTEARGREPAQAGDASGLPFSTT